MRSYPSCRWLMLMYVVLVAALTTPGWAQRAAQSEVTLDKVTLNATFIEVLNSRGVPHRIGPALTGADAITNLLNPPPVTAVIGGAMPPPDAVPAGVAAGASGAAKPQNIALKPQDTWMIWVYEGSGPLPDPQAPVITYVFFDTQGQVAGVVVSARSPQVSSVIRTESGIGFGTKLSDIVKKYDWPQPFTRVGPYYFCSYPVQNVTFSLDTGSRKVQAIAIGLPITVVRSLTSVVRGDGAAPAGALPGSFRAPTHAY